MPAYKPKLDKRYLADIADFVEKTLRKFGCQSKMVISDLQLAVDEASTNIMTHGKISQKRNYFTIRIVKDGSDIDIKIIDTGSPYPFDRIFMPPKDLPLEERLKGCFGISFIKAVTDISEYKVFPDQNILHLRKRFVPGGKTHGH